MTRSLAMDANNDLVLGPDGNLAFVADLAAVLQNCKSAMQTQLGEVALDTTRGIPTFDTVFTAWNPDQFEVAARAMLLSVSGVVAVTAFSAARANNIMSYTATIQTTFGTGDING